MTQASNQLVVQAMQWASIEDIDDASPLSDSDAECIREIRSVLKKHGRLDRFGLTLIHSHFPIADDEVLLEVVNKKMRILTIKPVKKSEIVSAVDTQWSLDGQVLMSCKVKCYIAPPGHEVDHL